MAPEQAQSNTGASVPLGRIVTIDHEQIRTALHQQPSGLRWLTFLGGAAVLFGYGVIVNTPDWDFGRLLGLYVVFFFIIAQLMSWVLFHQPPSTSTMVGGALIVAGGAVLAIANA